MLQRGIELIGNRVAGAARPVALRIAALNHKAVNDTVEDQSVIEALFHEVDEVLRRDGRLVLEEHHLEGTLVCRKFCNAICHSSVLSFILVQKHIE